MSKPTNNTKEVDDSYFCNPILENEHVGIDKETMYLDKEPMPLNVVLFLIQIRTKTMFLRMRARMRVK
jgi:hypothetical protein